MATTATAGPLTPAGAAARVYAPIGVPETGATLTAVPVDGRFALPLATRRGTPYWSVTVRVVAARRPTPLGAYAELRIWPAGRNRAWLAGRLSVLTGLAERQIEAMDDDARLAAVETGVAGASFAGRVATEADGRLVVEYVDARIGRVAETEALPLPAEVTPVTPPADVSGSGRGVDVAYTLIRDRAGVAEACRSLDAVTELALDIETDCGPLGTGRDWEPSDGAVRLLQLAWIDAAGETRTIVVDAYAVSPEPLVRLLARPELTVIAHNIRYEQRWLSFQFGLGRLRRPFDTSCALRILDRHWAATNPGYVAGDARLETAMRRFVGLPKQPYGASWWGADELSVEQLDYAALDAASLLPLAASLRAHAAAIGCEAQIEAASLRQVADATRRLPHAREVVVSGAERLLDAAADAEELERAAAALRTLALGVGARWRLAARYRERAAELEAPGGGPFRPAAPAPTA